MITSRDQYRHYTALYHDFTEAYNNAQSLTREFYPQAKKFVEHTEPELTRFMKKISSGAGDQGSSYAYQKLIHYVNHFDDFTLSANKLFTDLKQAIEKSDHFMNRLIELKLKHKTETGETPENIYTDLLPELEELTSGLKQIPERAGILDVKMKKLENDWTKTKEKIS